MMNALIGPLTILSVCVVAMAPVVAVALLDDGRDNTHVADDGTD